MNSTCLHERRLALQGVVRHACEFAPGVPLPDEEQLLLDKVFDYYHETLKRTPRALQFLAQRRLNDPALIDTFQLGFADRTLCHRLPDSESLEGGAVRGALQRLGVLRPSCHEHFRGALVVPICDTQGHVQDVYGRRIEPKLCSGDVYHLGLFRPTRGVFNGAAFTLYPSLVLCGSMLDALSFWCVGVRNVSVLLDAPALTDAMRTALQEAEVQEAVLAFRQDTTGLAMVRDVARQLRELGLSCRQVQFPAERDANWLAMHHLDARGALLAALASARPVPGPRRPRTG